MLRPGSLAIQAAVTKGWIVVKTPSPKRVETLRGRYQTLAGGELEAISLALGPPPRTLIIDEWLGRRIARLENIEVTGTFGLVARAVKKELLSRPAARDLIDALLRQGLWVSSDVLHSLFTNLLDRP